MPTSSGKLTLEDYDNALVAEGFDGFVQPDRYQMINLGYRAIARSFPFSWEITSQEYTLDPGSASISVLGTSTLGPGLGVTSPNTVAGQPNTSSTIRDVFVTTSPYRKKLQPLSEDEFMQRWLYLDLTDASVQGIPEVYYLWNGQLYILPPPNTVLNVLVWFNQFLPDMVAPTDTPVTPQIYDELILDAARVRAHRRAKELQLAAEAQMRVDSAIADMLENEAFSNWELDERVRPDDQWL